jgi:2-desacetyl-2-hydroxyethyl bacteriochlorophyllide A dehydrogenase
MNAIVNTAAGRLDWLELPLPEPGPGQVRIRTLACGVCATDLQMIKGWTRTGFPAIPGHEWCGVVDAIGPGSPATLAGKRCVAENVWADGGEVGFEHPGGYGQFFLTAADNVHVLPDDFPPEAGTLIEPLAVCVRALRRLDLKDRRGALVMGDGPIGLLLTGLLARLGVKQNDLIGGRPARLALAKDCGARQVINYHTDTLGSETYPNVLEASGSAGAVATALGKVEKGGRVLFIGDYDKACAGFAWNELLHKEWTLVGSNAGAGAWAEAVELARGGFPLGRLVSHRFPAARFQEAVETARSCPDAVKVVMVWA